METTTVDSKIEWPAGNMIYPLPAVLVSCGTIENKDTNLITISWTGTICTNPPMCYISVRQSRHSYELITKYREFVINLTTVDIIKQTDWCGVKSGKFFDKFKKTKLTPIAAKFVKAPIVAECPISIECKVNQIIPLGSHDMFIADVLLVHADKAYHNTETNSFDIGKAQLASYAHGKYYGLGKELGKFGFSVRKK